MKRVTLAVAALVFLGAGAGRARAEFVHLTLESQAGDFIGQGKSFDLTYTPQSPGFFFVGIGPKFAGGTTPVNVRFTLGQVTGDQSNTFTTLDFSTAQLGTAIQPGTYLDAQRAAFASAGHPGLDVSFQNRGSNTLTGQFTVNALTYATNLDGSFRLLTFDANFEQHSEGAAPALFGHIQYDANGVAATPEPASLAMLGLGAACLAGFAWRRGRTRATLAAA